MERLVWCLSTESSERIDASIKKAGELAEKVRPNWTKPNTTQTAEAELNLSSLPEWTTELFETSFVGRHAAFLGAMQGDEASFVALLLHNIFTCLLYTSSQSTVCHGVVSPSPSRRPV